MVYLICVIIMLGAFYLTKSYEAAIFHSSSLLYYRFNYYITISLPLVSHISIISFFSSFTLIYTAVILSDAEALLVMASDDKCINLYFIPYANMLKFVNLLKLITTYSHIIFLKENLIMYIAHIIMLTSHTTKQAKLHYIRAHKAKLSAGITII